MPREYLDYLNDIKEEIEAIFDFIKGLTFDSFRNEKKTSHAVIRSFEIIGEAAKKIPDDLKNECPEIPWKDVMRNRDKMIHFYFGVNLEIVWKTIEDDLHPLKTCIERIIRVYKHERD